MQNFFYLPVCLQSARRHSAIILTVTVNRLQQIHPVIYEGWNFNSGNYLFTTDTK